MIGEFEGGLYPPPKEPFLISLHLYYHLSDFP